MTKDTVQKISTDGVENRPDAPPTVENLYPQNPENAVTEVERADPGTQQVTTRGQPLPREKTRTGLEEELPVWEGRYSLKNFIGRFVWRFVLTLGWIALAAYTWGTRHGYENLPTITLIVGGLLLLYWLTLAWQVFKARMGYYYEMTTKRLFVTTGIFQRRRDQVELLRVDDVYVKQPSLFHRMFNVGTVVVESSEDKMPVSYLMGIDDPKTMMDLVWHHARTERDLHSVKVDEV